MTDALRKFAKELKLFRETKEISLNYIATRTKIDIKFLQAIEEGNFEIMPDLYIRAFLKEYAQVADFDVSEVMKKFDQAKKGLAEEKNVREKEVTDKESTKKEVAEDEIVAEVVLNNAPASGETIIESTGNLDTQSGDKLPTKQNLNNKYILGAAAFVVIGLLVYFLFFKESSTQIIYENPNDELVDNSGNRFEMGSSIEDVKTVLQDDSLTLVLNASGRVWVKVISDNKEVFQSFLMENQNMSFKAMDEFKVSVGNAGFISMQLNSKALPVVGTRGEVRNYIINADTVKSYPLSIPSKNENRSPNQN
jgi:transcriptional regulator with XRE-family HTH domain